MNETVVEWWQWVGVGIGVLFFVLLVAAYVGLAAESARDERRLQRAMRELDEIRKEPPDEA